MKPAIRKLSDMTNVVLNKEWIKTVKDRNLYYMFRARYKNDSDLKRAKCKDLRYDITEIPAGRLGKEFTKTKGHYHSKVPGTDLTYPEVYQVLEGKASYILQKSDGKEIKDIIIINAKKGDIVIIPPGYGHVTSNPGDRVLRMANWVSTRFDSLYGDYETKHGGAYFQLDSGGWIYNQNYSKLPIPKIIQPPDFKVLFAVDDMYELIEDLNVLDFLNNPQDHPEMFRFSK